MDYEYEPIKDLEKEIEYVRHNYEKITHTHQKAVVGTQIKKLESRLHKFKQAAKADEYEAKARAFNEIEYLQGEFDCGSEYRDFYSDVVKVIHRWQRGEFYE